VLEEIRLRGLGVIADATVALGPGMTAITGETGAGKTMVVAGLALLFGGRADTGRVRGTAGRTVVEGRLRLPSGHPALHRAVEAGAEPDEDGSLLLARTVGADGRSRAHLGGRAVPVALLAELGGSLLTAHGQADQLQLGQPAVQRGALDRYAGEPVRAALARHREAFLAWRQVTAELTDRSARARERAQEADLLRHGLAEIAAVDPQPAEDEALLTETRRLEHAEALRAAATTAHEALSGDPAADPAGPAADVAGLLAAARHAVAAVAGHDDRLAELGRRLDELGYLAADLAGELAGYAAELDADPGRLAAVHERRAALATLTRRYADTVDGVREWSERARRRLAELDDSAETLAGLAARRDTFAAELVEAAGLLTRARMSAAEEFAAAVTAELAVLAMPHARMLARVRRRPAGSGPVLELPDGPAGVGPDGVDDVELLLVPHAGSPPRPLAKGASGGELARVMLAVEVVFAGADPVPTMVFDEVDAGVGGRAAVEVGRRLARLARHHQVIVVTHLPQVAAFADRQLVVVKDEQGAVTASGVRAVAGGERAQELARMLAGLDGSELGRAHAEELLAVAAADRPAGPG